MNHSRSHGKPVVYVVGDAVAPTGFSRVVQGIMEPIAQLYDIHQMALNYFGDPHDWPWKLYPAFVGGSAFGTQRIAQLFDKVAPDLVFIVSNLGSIQAYLEKLGERVHKAPIIAYCPIEAGPVSLSYGRGLNGIDCLVLYTEYSKNLMIKTIEK